MAYTETHIKDLDENIPSGASEKLKILDNAIREVKKCLKTDLLVGNILGALPLQDFFWNIKLDFTGDSDAYSIEAEDTNRYWGVITQSKRIGVKTGAQALTGTIAAIAANTTYYVHLAVDADGAITATVNTTSTPADTHDCVVGEYRTEKATAEIAHKLLYGPVIESDARVKVAAGTFQITADGNVAVTGLGFKPKKVDFKGSYSQSYAGGFYQSVGSMINDGTQQYIAWSYEKTPANNAYSRAGTDKCCLIMSELGVLSGDLAYVSMDNDGFTVVVANHGYNAYFYWTAEG